MENNQQLSDIEIKIINEINDLSEGPLKMFKADKESKRILFEKKIHKPNTHIALGVLFLNKMKSQSESSVKLGIPMDQIVFLTSGYEIEEKYMKKVMKEYKISQKDIQNVIDSEYKKHIAYVDNIISILNKYNYEGIEKKDLLIDKSEFTFLENRFGEFYQSVKDFQLLMSSLITDVMVASDDEYSLNYHPDYAEKESLMWVLLRKFANMTYEEISDISEGEITANQLATLECPYQTDYDDTTINRLLYFKLLKNNFPSYINTFKLMDYTESDKKVMFINVPILRKDKDRLINHMERNYCQKVLLDNTKMYLARLSFVKK